MKRTELRILLDKWYEALYSGEFKQGTGTYCRILSDGSKKYCCLGVLAHVAGIEPTGLEPLGSSDFLCKYSVDDHKKLGLFSHHGDPAPDVTPAEF